MPLQATSGAASYDAFGGGVAAVPTYIEDVFSTWLYTGNFNSLTISNGIDLLNNGGMVWTKSRTNSGTVARNNHFLIDSARGWAGSSGQFINSNTTAAQSATETAFVNPLANGYTLGQARYGNDLLTYASWTFRKQPKFFDVVTYTGNSVSGRLIPHNLNSAPGCIIIKSTNLAGTNWAVWHRSLATGFALQLQGTNAAFSTKPQWFNSSTQGSSTTFEVGNDTDTNETGNTYVAYLFAHNAGGFGLTGTDNVISCGSYTGNGSTTGPSVTLGYEPQWVLIKRASGGTQNWIITDNMRDFSLNGNARLFPNLADAESSVAGIVQPNATGFSINGTTGSEYNASGNTYIYIAIRRGPMRTPTSGTSVFSPNLVASDSNPITTGFPVDMFIDTRNNAAANRNVFDRLRGGGIRLFTNLTDLEDNIGLTTQMQSNTSVTPGVFGNSSIVWSFCRAPSVFDVVCYAGTGANQTVSHNLGVVPELCIFKSRTSADDWYVRVGNNSASMLLNGTGALAGSFFNDGDNTASLLTTRGSNNSGVNGTGNNYVAYLFASCPGVSKVFNYTGNGSSQTINCGFTGGARFVLIKRTDSTGDWYVWDTARGIVANNDPHLSLNSTAAEVTTNDTIDTDSTGFVVNQVSATNVNVNGASYIGLAIA